MRPGDALNCSDPSNVRKRRQPFADPFKTQEGVWAREQPNWGMPYVRPEPAAEATERQLRTEDI